MDLKEFTRKKVLELIKESAGDINAAQQILSSIKQFGVQYIESDVNFNTGKIYITIAPKGKDFPYSMELDIDFEITDAGYNTPGEFGGSIDTSRAPEGEPAEWKMELSNAKVLGDGGEPVYEGRDAFIEFFKENYWELHNHFDAKITEKESAGIYEVKKIKINEFIELELKKLHEKFLLEDRKSQIEKDLNLLKEDVGVNNPNNLPLASGNPLDGRSKQSAVNYIYKIYRQKDHGQRYRDTGWGNVHDIFNTFVEYGIDTHGGYNAEYNPGGMTVDATTPQWKRWLIDFNYTDKKGNPAKITFVLKAHAAGTMQDPWDSYDISFYPIG